MILGKEFKLKYFNMLNICHVLKYFYKFRNTIQIDIDGKARERAIKIISCTNLGKQINHKFKNLNNQKIMYYDNYKYGGVLSYTDCYSELHIMTQKKIIQNILSGPRSHSSLNTLI